MNLGNILISIGIVFFIIGVLRYIFFHGDEWSREDHELAVEEINKQIAELEKELEGKE